MRAKATRGEGTSGKRPLSIKAEFRKRGLQKPAGFTRNQAAPMVGIFPEDEEDQQRDRED